MGASLQRGMGERVAQLPDQRIDPRCQHWCQSRCQSRCQHWFQGHSRTRGCNPLQRGLQPIQRIGLVVLHTLSPLHRVTETVPDAARQG